MTGMQTVIALRQSGFKPTAVFVDLVELIGKYDAEIYAFDELRGNVRINIARAESLNDIDFRPLVGLRVHVSDCTNDVARHRKLASLIARANASHMVMPVWEGETLAVHQRFAGDPARTESFRV
jgi:hypothetical protein